jgi:hypothetical protein
MAGLAVVRGLVPHTWRLTSLIDLVANGNTLSSSTSSDPEKRDDVEIVDWDGPNDPENPYEQSTLFPAGNILTFSSFNWSVSRKWVLTITTCFM